MLFIAATFALLALGQCGNYTVTEEAWFDMEVQDMDGPGMDYRYVNLSRDTFNLTHNRVGNDSK